MMTFMKVRPGRVSNPWVDMRQLRDEMDRVFAGAGVPEECETPLMNVTRLPDRMVVEAVAPGVDPSKIDVTSVGNTLTIRGERREQPSVEAQAYHRRERSVEHFVRTLRMDDRVHTEKIAATYRDGILRIELPYAPEAQPRKVDVKVN
jgi:HSP20 family protein